MSGFLFEVNIVVGSGSRVFVRVPLERWRLNGWPLSAVRFPGGEECLHVVRWALARIFFFGRLGRFWACFSATLGGQCLESAGFVWGGPQGRRSVAE